MWNDYTRTTTRSKSLIHCLDGASLTLPNSWQTRKIYTTQHTPRSRFCVFVGTGFFRVFTAETHVAQTARRSRRSSFLAQRRFDDSAEICRKTGFDRGFVTRWISRYNDSGSLDDAAGAGRKRKLSKSVERTVEKKMRGKRRRSSRVIARELKKQKVADVSYSTVQRTMHRRDLHAFRQRKASRLSKTQAWSIAVR